MALGLTGAALRAAPFGLSQTDVSNLGGQLRSAARRRTRACYAANLSSRLLPLVRMSTRSQGARSKNLPSNILEIRQSFHGDEGPIPYLILLHRQRAIQISGKVV